MNNQVEQIKAEIERLIDYSKVMSKNAINNSMMQFYDGMKESCENIRDFINSLPNA